MRRLLAIFIFLAALLAWSLVCDSQAQTDWAGHEKALLDLINQARLKPLETARAMGLDTERLLTDLSELRDILLNGLPPLMYDERLHAAAAAHTSDMASNGYYSHISKDGRGWEQRILEAGYIPSSSGETLGMISFSNFLQPAAAVEALFRNIFEDELRADRKEKRNILSSDMEALGLSMRTGVVFAGGSRLNVYLLTCDFAKNGAAELEERFLYLINEARRNPLGMAESLGLDREKVLSDLPNMAQLLDKGLPALEWNRLLKAASEAWISEVAERGYVLGYSESSRSPAELLLAHGYLPLKTASWIGLAAYKQFASPVEAAEALFAELFKGELDPDRTGDRVILDSGLKEVAVSFDLAHSALRQGEAPTPNYAGGVVAGSNAAPQVEAQLLLLINEARNRPAEALKDAGFDPDETVSARPWLKEVLDNGLPPLWNNSKLQGSASAHTLDMAKRNYLSGTSPDGVDNCDRIRGSGYEASVCAGAVAAVGVSGLSAADISLALFKAMLEKEIGSSNLSERVIFNPGLTEAGVGVGGAVFSQAGLSGYFAAATVDAGARASGESPRDAAETLFLELVNEARSDPLGMAAALGMSPEAMLALVRGWGGDSLSDLGAVYLNNRLWLAARGHSDDMADRGYLSHITLPEGASGPLDGSATPPGGPFRPGPPGKSYRDRIIEQGYTPMICGELLGTVDLEQEAFPEEAVWRIFAERFLQEISPDWEGERLILNPDFQEIGVGLSAGVIAPESGDSKAVYVMVVDFATSYIGVERSVFWLTY
jgi:uncharacterized protein YkwD